MTKTVEVDGNRYYLCDKCGETVHGSYICKGEKTYHIDCFEEVQDGQDDQEMPRSQEV